MEEKLLEIKEPYEIADGIASNEKRLYGTLLYSGSGEVKVDTEKTSILLKQGDMLYLRPMTVFTATGAKVTELRIDIHTLELPLSYAYGLYKIIGENPKANESIAISGERAERIFDLIAMLKEQKNAFSPDAYIAALETAKIIAESAEPADMPKYRDITNITAYIDAHSSESLEAAKLAEMCGMSYPTFARRFKEYYGRSFKEHINRVRAVKARRLLMNTSLDLSVIAVETGFFDSSHLIRTFKKIMGVTPNRERNIR